MIEFFGHFHPVLVHLPIGILLVALFLQWIASKEKYSSVKVAIPLVLLLGSTAAIVSGITGYFLSISDDYDQSLVNWHMWMAIGVILVALILYTKEVNPKVEVSKKLLSIGLLILIMLTGHFGGSLTHGSDYLTKPLLKIFSNDTTATTNIKPLPNVQEALAYNDIIQPILKTKCYSCHNANKQKGGLRMDEISQLLKGGKNGSIIDVNNVDLSEMLQRLLLPVDNDDHMPPKEKPQPTEAQIALLHWWISNRSDFKKKVKDLDQPEKIKPVLIALQKQVDIKKKRADIPADPVEKANDKTIAQLREKGWLLLTVSQFSNYLDASLTKANSVDKDAFDLISKLSKQIIFLKINNNSINEDAVTSISKLKNLRKLNLTNTNLTDNGVQQLKSLQNLQQLNIVGTKVSSKGLLQLKNLSDLKTIYIYQTNISKSDSATLKTAFSKTDIVFGNYVVPLLTTDTTVVKATKAK